MHTIDLVMNKSSMWRGFVRYTTATKIIRQGRRCIFIKAIATKANVVTGVTLSLKGSGAQLFGDAFKFSKTIGKAVAAKKGLTGKAATDYAASLQRALRRARVALAGV